MSEKFGVYSAFRDCPAVDGYIFVVLACAPLMDYLREELLACPAFAVNEHGEVNGRDTDCTRHRLKQCRGIAYDTEPLLGAHH